MAVKPEEFESAIKAAGYYVQWCKTGCPTWVRGYIRKMGENGIPCQYGRASFWLGELYNVKLYWRQYSGSDLNESDYLAYAWMAYQVNKQFLTHERYEEIVAQAWVLQKAEFKRRLELRAETQKRNPKKRRSIKGRCVRNYINEIIRGLVSDQEGETQCSN
ncbi:hypothetical protein VPHK120G1_0034 [Vibrio phage K120 g1]